MKKKENLKIITFGGSIVPSTSLGYHLWDLFNVTIPPFSILASSLMAQFATCNPWCPSFVALSSATHYHTPWFPPPRTSCYLHVGANSLRLQDYLGVSPLIFYRIKDVEILVKGNILLLSQKQFYLPHLIENQSNIWNLNPLIIFH